MLTIHQIQPTPKTWKHLESFADRTVYQTREWMDFVAQTQQASPVWGEVCDGSTPVGYFSGLTFRKFGITILGSPFPGWTTMYMGFNLQPEVPSWLALQALEKFAFNDLGCLHFEVADRRLTAQDAGASGFEYEMADTYETDLTQTEDAIFQAMDSACRRCIRKAQKENIQIEEASDETFAGEYFEQLKDVFLKQGLVPTYDLARVETLIRQLLPTGRLLLLRARDPEGNCIATGIYPGMNQRAQFWGNASFRSAQHFRPNEALHWYAMRYWKQRGLSAFDWGGGGTYKEKYGCRKVSFPWFRKSRFPVLEQMRAQARSLVSLSQRVQGKAREIVSVK